MSWGPTAPTRQRFPSEPPGVRPRLMRSGCLSVSALRQGVTVASRPRLLSSVAVVVGVLLAVAGCAAAGRPAGGTATSQAPNASAVAAPSGFLPPTSASRLGAPEHLANADVDLNVPSAAQAPTLSFSQAYAQCGTAEVSCVRGLAPTIILALVTTPNAGADNADGSTQPLLNRRLAYVLTWTNVPCVPVGAVVGATPTPQKCTVNDFIDAATGKFLYGAEGGT
jgi:hypothetical protein